MSFQSPPQLRSPYKGAHFEPLLEGLRRSPSKGALFEPQMEGLRRSPSFSGPLGLHLRAPGTHFGLALEGLRRSPFKRGAQMAPGWFQIDPRWPRGPPPGRFLTRPGILWWGVFEQLPKTPVPGGPREALRAPGGVRMVPGWSQDGSKMTQKGVQKMGIIFPSLVDQKVAPRWPQDGSKLTQDGPRMVPR